MKLAIALTLLLFSRVTCIAEDFERNSFSVSLPAGWKYRSDGNDDPAELFSFFGPSTCYFAVMIFSKRSAGRLDSTLKDAQEIFLEKFVNIRHPTAIRRWGKYRGKGIAIEATPPGKVDVKVRIFAFENPNWMCVTMEMVSTKDSRQFATDFWRLRRTFQLKVTLPPLDESTQSPTHMTLLRRPFSPDTKETRAPTSFWDDA